MFARIVSLDLRPNTHKQFSELFEKHILPALRKQQGFKDEILLVDPGAPRVVAISTWETKENAEAYAGKAYPDAVKSLAEVLEGVPDVRTYQLAFSTLYQIAIGVAAANQSTITNPTPGVGD
jgi:heme-degrading monooxygenase HmoA